MQMILNIKLWMVIIFCKLLILPLNMLIYRDNKKAIFIEAITYRWFGHVDWREDIDVGIERSKEDIKLWRSRDPINRLKSSMIENNIWSNEEHFDLEREIKQMVNKYWEIALKDPFPEKQSLIEDVYSS